MAQYGRGIKAGVTAGLIFVYLLGYFFIEFGPKVEPAVSSPKAHPRRLSQEVRQTGKWNQQ